MNLSFSKRFPIRDKGSLQFRWEVFNVTNHANLALPVNSLDTPNRATITQAQPARVMQIALKYSF